MPTTGHGDLGVFLQSEDRVQRAVFAQHIVNGRHGCHQADLGEKTGDPQHQHPPADFLIQREVAASGTDDFHVEQIPDGHHSGRNLSDNRGHCCSHHAPLATEDKERVQNDIDDRAQEGGGHGKSRVAVRPDDGVHSLAEHVERDAQGNIEEILLRVVEGLLIDCSTEHRNDGIGKDEVDGGQHKTAGHGQNDRIAHAVLRFAYLISAQAYADKGAAAVPHQDGDGQCHHRQRKDHRIGGVAVGTEITGIGDEDLVHDVVKGAHQ